MTVAEAPEEVLGPEGTGGAGKALSVASVPAPHKASVWSNRATMGRPTGFSFDGKMAAVFSEEDFVDVLFAGADSGRSRIFG
jgi:hypothetical protein